MGREIGVEVEVLLPDVTPNVYFLPHHLFLTCTNHKSITSLKVALVVVVVDKSVCRGSCSSYVICKSGYTCYTKSV